VTAILGVNAYHGDAAAALILDGKLIAAAEEERFTRVKHVAGFPVHAVRWCLAEAGLQPRDLDHIAVSRDPRANIGRALVRTIRHGASARYLKARLDHAARVRDARLALSAAYEVDASVVRARLHDVEHHRAHAASAFLVSPFDEAAIVTVDGFGDFCSTMLAVGRGDSVEVLDRVLFPHSLGMFYTALTQWLGFPAYGDEGKVMGLAPYGDEHAVAKAMRDIVVPADGLFLLDLDYFVHDEEGVDMLWDDGAPTIAPIYSKKLVETFGTPRHAQAPISRHHMDVAAALQARLEEIYLHVVEQLGERTGLRRLCLAGGVALNAVANGRILPETTFEALYVPPAAGDAGTAVGAALHVWNEILGRPRELVMRSAYTGPAYGDAECAAAITEAGVDAVRLDDESLVIDVAQRIAAGEIVGWFQGRMELGPRALGHRSIVADPRRAEVKDVLNARIKHREAFRPFAVSVLADATGQWFDQDAPSPFMSHVYKTLPARRAQIAAADHVDHTCRVQTVERDVEPRYYRLIEEFERQTGVPVLLNTSFNENEPIVMTPAEAVDTFLKTRMDVLVLGNYVVRRNGAS
jgi:carbamoyltransferase